MNSFNCIGNAGADPVLKQTQSGKQVCEVGICVRRPTKDKQGKYENDWFRVEAWGKTGEILAQYVKKGHKFGVCGRIEIETWTDKQGKPGTTVKIIANTIELIEAPPGRDGGYQEGTASTEQTQGMFAS